MGDREAQLVWLAEGLQRGWISEAWCAIHESAPLTDDEREMVDAWDGDLDAVCVPAVRLHLPED